MLLALITCHVRRDLLEHVRCATSRHVVIVVEAPPAYTVPRFRASSLGNCQLRNWTRLASKFLCASTRTSVTCFETSAWFQSTLPSNSSSCPAPLLRPFRTPLEERMLRLWALHFVARSRRELLLLLLHLLPLAASSCSMHVPLHSFSARSGHRNLRCLSCALVSHVCPGVPRSLPVRVYPTQAIKRCSER